MDICLASIHPRMLSGQIEGVLALRAGLEGLGHRVRLVSAFHEDDLGHERRWARDTGDGLSLTPKIVRIGRIIGNIASTARSCDLVHFNVPTPAFAVLGDLLRIATGRPVVVGFEAHLANVPAVAKRLTAAPEFYAPRLLVNNGLVARLTLRRAARYIVSSDHQRRELLSLGYQEGRVTVIPNLIDETKLHPWRKSDARQALGLPDGPLVAFAGHYHDVKGHDVLIEALPAVCECVPDARLVLAWSGIGHRARVQSLIHRLNLESRVIELGRVDVGQLFSAADVVALPYRFTIGQAAYPGTVFEAMCVGLPLVTTDLPLLAELSDSGRTALLARPGDAGHLAECVARLLSDPARATQIVESQRDAMATRFRPSQLIEDYVVVYEQALEEPRATGRRPAGIVRTRG